MRRILLLASALVLTGLPAIAKQVVEPGPSAPGPRVFPPSDGPGDIDPTDRFEAYSKLLPKYFTPAFAKHTLAEVRKQQKKYPNLVPGAQPGAAPLWTSIGPSNNYYTVNGVEQTVKDSGRLRAILPNPANRNQLYVLSAGGGLWRTDNLLAQRTTWQPLTDGVANTGGGAAIGRDFNTIYLGLGDPFETTPALGGIMLRSTDGGQTWDNYVFLNATQVRDVKVDTSGGTDVILAATDGGLYRSADGGLSYTLVSTSDALAGLEAWSIERTSAGWLATFVQPGLGLTTSSAGTVALSTDGGATWAPVSGAGSFAASGRITVAVGAPGDATVYAIASDVTGYSQSDAFRSTDGGLTWTALGLGAGKMVTNPTCWQSNTNFLNGQAYYNQSLLVDPADASRNTIYIGGNLSLGKSTDGGATFTQAAEWLPGSCDDGSDKDIPYVHADHHANAVIGSGKNEILLFGTDGGLFLSTDRGASFDSTKNRGLVDLLTQTVASTRTTALVSGLQDNGVRARQQRRSVWNQIFGGDGEGVAGSRANDATTLVSGYYSNIYGLTGGVPKDNRDYTNSVDNRYYNAQGGIDLNNDIFPFFTPLHSPWATADKTGLVFFTFTGSTVYRTNDGGKNWNQLVRFTDGTGTPFQVFRLSWNELSTAPGNPSKIAVGGTGGHAVITTDGFATDQNFNYVALNGLGLGYNSFNASSAWTWSDEIYFASQSPNFGVTRVVKTADAGANWSAAATGLPDVPVNQVLADHNDRTGKTLYAATWIGVYVTRDGGQTWNQFGAGLPVVQVSSLDLSSNGKTLRAATYGRGVWVINLR